MAGEYRTPFTNGCPTPPADFVDSMGEKTDSWPLATSNAGTSKVWSAEDPEINTLFHGPGETQDHQTMVDPGAPRS